MKCINDIGIGESFYLKKTVVAISTRTGTPCEFDEERIDINELFIAELEKIKETFCDMRDGYPKITDETLTVREIIEIIDKRIKELNNES